MLMSMELYEFAKILFNFGFCIYKFVRYKAVIILEGLCGIITWSLLLWTKSYFGAQLLEVFYAFYANCEVAYFAYIYAKVSKEHFLAVSSHTRAALLLGRFSSGVLSQTLLNYKLMDVRTLNYLTFAAQIAATIVAILLPKVNESIYFYRGERSSIDNLTNQNQTASQTINCNMCQQAFGLMWTQLKCAYTNRRVILWSIWYACGFCMYVQFIAYVQLVWIEIDNRPEVNDCNGKNVLKPNFYNFEISDFQRSCGMVLLMQ